MTSSNGLRPSSGPDGSHSRRGSSRSARRPPASRAGRVGVGVAVRAGGMPQPERPAGQVTPVARHRRVAAGERVRPSARGRSPSAWRPASRQSCDTSHTPCRAGPCACPRGSSRTPAGHHAEDAVGRAGHRRVGLAHRVAAVTRDRRVPTGQGPGGLRVVEAGAGFHACSVWHDEQARPASCPRCSSLWQEAQSAAAWRNERCLWHCSQESARCFPASACRSGRGRTRLDRPCPTRRARRRRPGVRRGTSCSRGTRPARAGPGRPRCGRRALVAGEALARGHALLRVVALQAAAAALELRVDRLKGPGEICAVASAAGPSASVSATATVRRRGPITRGRPTRSPSRPRPRRGRS